MHFFFTLFSLCFVGWINADNQTPDVSPINPAEDFPFDIEIKRLAMRMPMGLQGYVMGEHEGKWLVLAGRMNGLHGFNNDPNNFPPNQQNTNLFVLDFKKCSVTSRSLLDSNSGLNQEQIDSLSVTAPQAYRSGKTLYMSGGYGFQTSTLQFITWPYLTAIDIPRMIKWVNGESEHLTAADCMRQTTHPLLRVTGGNMDKIGTGDDPTLLVMGQDFEGTYFFGVHTQVYTQQIRKFNIIDDGKNLEVQFIDPDPADINPGFRRRDLNILRVVKLQNGKIIPGLSVLSGVFTLTGGAWTVPVDITKKGVATMADPNNPATFKQGANNYSSSCIGLFSKKNNEMYLVLCGGITYEYFVNGIPQFDSELPFTNQVTAIKIDGSGNYSQYLLNGSFPTILSKGSNPGNPLLFGASASFFPRYKIDQYIEYVLKYDAIKKPKVIGYIMGGIQSTLPNTNTSSDSAASPYIFKVTLIPKN